MMNQKHSSYNWFSSIPLLGCVWESLICLFLGADEEEKSTATICANVAAQNHFRQHQHIKTA